MKFKLGSLLTVMALIISQSCWAYHCPSAQAIKERGITFAKHMTDMKNIKANSDWGYAVGSISKYDTPVLWMFYFWPIDAVNEIDAMDKGKGLLNLLSGEIEKQSTKECLYGLSVGPMYLIAMAQAITPF